MPLFINNGLDDPLLIDQCNSFVGGQVSFTRPHLIGPLQAAELVNIDIAQNGIAQTRRGVLTISSVPSAVGHQAICYYDVPGRERLVAISNNHLYEYDPDVDAWSAGFDIAAGDTTGINYPADAVQGINKVYTGSVAGISSWDGTALTALVDAPQTPIILWFTNRLFAAGSLEVPDQLNASDFLDGSLWDPVQQSIRIGAGEGDPIMGLAPWIGIRLVVFKRGSVWVVYADPTLEMANWSVELVHRRIGCVSRKTIVQVGQDVWFLSDTGVRSVAKTAGTDLNAIGPALSFPIQDLIDRINWRCAESANAIFWGNRYLLSVPLDDSQTPNYVLVYNVDTQSWSGYWTGWNAAAMAITAFGGLARLWIGKADGTLAEWLDYVPVTHDVTGMYEDGELGVDLPVDLPFDLATSAGYTSSIKTRALQFGEPLNNKHGQHIEIEWQNSEANSYLSLIANNNETIVLNNAPSRTTSPELPIDLPFDLVANGTYRRALDLMQFDVFREAQFRIYSDGGLLALRGISATAFLDTMEMDL